MNPDRIFRYFGNCIDWAADDVTARDGLVSMIDGSRPVTRRTFLSLVCKEDLRALEDSLGYASHPTRGLTMAADPCVDYFTSRLHGAPCAYFRHSAVEYVFVPS